MKKLLFLLVAVSILWVYQAQDNPASAHGGQYRGPAGEVPPGSRDPKDPQPPPENPGTPTPPSGGDTGTPPPGGADGTPTPEPPKPKSPDAGGPTAGAPSGGAVTERGKVAPPKAMSYENWLFWWNYNKDEFLNLKAAVKAMENAVSTKNSAHFFGAGGNRNRTETQAPTEKMIQDLIIPKLQQVLANKDMHPDIRGGAVIALARCRGGLEDVKAIMEMAKHNSGEDKLVQESAILALAMMQVKTAEVRDFLIGLVDNMDVAFRARCFAALTLGLLKDNSPETFAALERRLDGRESTPDVPVCALLAIGLIGDEKKVPDLVKWLDAGGYGKSRFGDLEKAYVVSALGKIGSPEALKSIEATLKRKDSLARRSAMIAFGQIVPQADAATQADKVEKLVAVLENEDDATALNFGLISLGRIGGQDDVAEPVRKAALTALSKHFKSGSNNNKPYAALALGVLGFQSNPESPKPAETKYQIIDLIRRDLAEMKGDKIALGAQAVALGLVGEKDADTVKLLANILADRGNEKKLRGAAAIALGLIGDASAREAILKALEEREDRDLRVDTAVAAGLLGDSSAVEKLVEILNDPKASQFVLGSVALALGQIGDRRAFEPLLKILEPEKANGVYPDLTRALVVVALGQISDRSDYRVLYRLSKDVNYRASVSALDEILTIM
jgi:HEAT repeat protein